MYIRSRVFYDNRWVIMLELICFIVGDNDEVFFINKVSFFDLFNIKDVIREGNRKLGLFLFLIM